MAVKSTSRTRKPTARKAQAQPKATARKAQPKAQPKPEPSRRPNRTQADWDKLALETIVPALQAGTSMTEIRSRYGAGPTIRRALDRVGYNTKGEKVTATKVAGSNTKVLANRVAARRKAGAAWWRLEHETGRSMDELKAILAKHGHANLAEGRVVTSKRGLRKLEKANA
jgi:hypothetical protein